MPSLNVPYFSSKIDGRIDVSRDTQIILENRFLLSTDNPGSPNLTAGLARLPINTDLGGTLGVVQSFNRLSVTLKGTFDRAVYDNSVLTNGESTSNADRNFNQTAGILRVGYELDPGLKPFVEVEGDQRIHDEEFDRSGLERSSIGFQRQGRRRRRSVRLAERRDGGRLCRSLLQGSDVAGCRAASSPTASLIWQATALTTAKLTATSQVNETVIARASGELSRDLALQVDHAFLRWLIGTLKVGYGTTTMSARRCATSAISCPPGSPTNSTRGAAPGRSAAGLAAGDRVRLHLHGHVVVCSGCTCSAELRRRHRRSNRASSPSGLRSVADVIRYSPRIFLISARKPGAMSARASA